MRSTQDAAVFPQRNNPSPVLCAPVLVSGVMRGVSIWKDEEAGAGFEPEHLIQPQRDSRRRCGGNPPCRKFESIRNTCRPASRRAKFDYKMVGASEALQAVSIPPYGKRHKADGATVLIIGETGTGKEMVAHGIHEPSAPGGDTRSWPSTAGRFSRLFAKRALWPCEGLIHRRSWRPEKESSRQADGGTVFLDEIGELTMLMQSAPAGSRVPDIRTGGQRPVRSGERTHCRRNERGSGGGRPAKEIPSGFALPPERCGDPDPSSPRTA